MRSVPSVSANVGKSRFFVRIPRVLCCIRKDLLKLRPELKTELNFMPIQLKTSRFKFYIVFLKETMFSLRFITDFERFPLGDLTF